MITPSRTPKDSQMMPAPMASESVAGRPWRNSLVDVDALGVGDDRAAEDLLHRLGVLDVDRLIETQLLADQGDRGGVGVGPADPRGRVVVGDHLEDPEDEDGDHEQHADDGEPAADDESPHQ